MKALISPRGYHKKSVFESEKTSIFSSIWNFMGLKSEFKNVNDFKTLSIGGVPVVVQNCKGQLKCFKNICSHRHAVIQIENEGNRPLFCPYHGWAYDDQGLPTGIPKKPLFSFTKQEMECLKLEEFRVDFCGELVFVNISKSEVVSLRDYLGHIYDDVQKISSNFGQLVDVNEMEINSNWKILVENTLESYHVNLVHNKTFKRLGAGGLKFNFNGMHSSWEAPLLLRENEGKQKRINKPYAKRKFKIDGYNHILLFPNILISSTYGISFNLSQIVPLSPQKSLFKSYVFLTKYESDGEVNAMEENYKKSLIEFNRSVFDEDKEICEKVQLGVKHSHVQGELSEEEERVFYFQKGYIKLMGKNI